MQQHLIAQTNPIASKENVIFFENYRVTVLDGGLFRIEKSESGSFNDNATQSVWFRNMPPHSFSVKTQKDFISIKTDRAKLILHKIFSNSRVILNGQSLPLDNTDNLLGTNRTLDRFDGEYNIVDKTKLVLGNGVCSRSGVAVIDDTDTLTLTSDGRLAPPFGELMDIYVFAYGKDYRSAVRALYMVCGSTPILPRFAFGNWWSRFHAYTDKEYLTLMDDFEEHGIPLTVATLDIDWHYSDNVDEEKQITARGKNTLDRGCLATEENKRIGWTGYSWNTRLFPDYRAFLRELQRRNLKITLNLHPASGVRYYEDMYEEMARAMGIDSSTEKAVEFDISDPHFVEEYFKILHHPYEKDGVDFWWIDWQQGTKTAMEGLDPLWALNHYHYLDNGRNHKYPLIMSRYAGIGSHRYPIGFSGDTSVSWRTLELMPYFTSTSANCGYTWWGHDIGGHHLGIKDDELYLRFIQYAVFNPINRAHSTSSELISKEPWMYENGIGELATRMLVLRHRMIPFLYTCNYLTHKEGLALCEPMYYQYPDCEESYIEKYRNQYMFGQNLMVVPITRHSEENNLCSVDIWLPEGIWTDIFTGDVYRIGKGGREFCAVRSLDSIPVFAKAGTVIPLSNDRGNNSENPTSLEARIYNGSGEYNLYEDSENREAFTKFTLTEDENTQFVNIKVVGDVTVIPQGRSLTLSFQNITVRSSADFALGLNCALPSVTVLKNGVPCEAKIKGLSDLRITVENLDPEANYEIRVKKPPLDSLTEFKRALMKKLQKVQGNFSERDRIYKKLIALDDTNIIMGYIQHSELKVVEKKRLEEIFLCL